jgi:hypothetical protein
MWNTHSCANSDDKSKQQQICTLVNLLPNEYVTELTSIFNEDATTIINLIWKLPFAFFSS